MKNSIVVVIAGVLFPALAVGAPPTQCPFTPDELKAALGQSFEAGVPENGLLGKGCTYKAGDVKLWLDAGPLPVPTADQWRKLANPPGTKWKAVAGDPDKAVHNMGQPGATVYPSVSYERGGWLVNILVTGVSGQAAIDDWSRKLVKLRRIP